MVDSKKYVIFAGINGVGKTALHRVLSENADLGKRISIDDIVLSMGDWHDPLVQIKAARKAMAELRAVIDEGLTFHQETTLPGEAIIRYADLARSKGYRVVLHYIGVASLDIAKERVRHRVEEGGHGIDEKIMEKRFADMYNFLFPLIERCDEVYFYDNSLRFTQIAVMLDGVVTDLDADRPDWFKDMMAEREERGTPHETVDS